MKMDKPAKELPSVKLKEIFLAICFHQIRKMKLKNVNCPQLKIHYKVPMTEIQREFPENISEIRQEKCRG